MPAPPVGKTPWGRLLLGALISALFLVPGDRSSFAYTLPLLVLCGGWLAWRVEGRLGRAGATVALGLLLVLPAFSQQRWEAGAAILDAVYLDPAFPAQGVLALAGRATQGVAPLLLSAAAGCLVLQGRVSFVVVGILTGAALGTMGAGSALAEARLALAAGDAMAAAWLTAGVPFAGLSAVVGGAPGLLLARPARVGVLLAALLVLLMAGQAATPPLGDLVEVVLTTRTDEPVPTGPPGEGTARALLDPNEPDLEGAGFTPTRHPSWPCAKAGWPDRLRATVAFALPATSDLSVLDAGLDPLESFLIDRVALVGRADAQPPGVLGPLLEWPVAMLLIDRPPAGTRWARLGPEGLSWEETEPAPGARATCGILPAPGLSIEDLYTTARRLQTGGAEAPCAALALVPPRWRPADPSAPLSTLSCPAP